MYLDEKGNANTDLSQNGRLAVGVPVLFQGCFIPIKNMENYLWLLIQPAIDLAEKGFAVTLREANLLNSTKEDFLKHNSHKTAFTKEFLGNKEIFIQKELANT
jgi:gamma-glutamyltranspeptidase/glutathione hydrolase